MRNPEPTIAKAFFSTLVLAFFSVTIFMGLTLSLFLPFAIVVPVALSTGLGASVTAAALSAFVVSTN